jgi:hypothetical protein
MVDMTLKMYMVPTLELDPELLEHYREKVQARQEQDRGGYKPC